MGAQLSPYLNSTLSLFDKYANKINKYYMIGKAAYNITDLGTKAYLTWNYWDQPHKTGICESNSPSTGALEVQNCAVKLTLDHDLLTLRVGDKFKYTVSALDKDGKTTLPPTGIFWESSDPNYVFVDKNGVITVLKELPYAAIISATDPSTQVKGTAAVYAGPVTADISIVPNSIPLGDSATLTWSSKYADKCQATGAWSGDISTSGSMQVTPKSVGSHSYSISCDSTIARGSASGSTTLNVTNPIYTKPTIVNAWVKINYKYLDVTLQKQNALNGFYHQDAVNYISQHTTTNSSNMNGVGVTWFICDAIGNPSISPGDCTLRFLGETKTQFTTTLHEIFISEVVVAQNFTPNPTVGPVESIVVQVHPSWNNGNPNKTISENSFEWVKESAYIIDRDGNGFDDNGEHDKPSNWNN